MRRFRAVVLAWAFVFSGCSLFLNFSEDGLLCGPSGECRDGYDCQDGRCVKHLCTTESCKSCPDGQFDNGSGCAPFIELGKDCVNDVECQSGHCAHGVCCLTSCNGDCQVCSTEGSCGFVADGTPCDDGLACTSTDACGAEGICKGADQCTTGLSCMPGGCAACLSGYRDQDGDTYSTSERNWFCGMANLPAGWVPSANGNDCNDQNAAVWINRTGYKDMDGDTFTSGGAVSLCSGAALPTGYRASANPEDCNDSNAGIVDFQLLSGEQLAPGQKRTSCSGSHALIMQPDGNLVLQHGGNTIWRSATNGNAGAFAFMQSDGNLVVYLSGTPLWNSQTAGNPGAWLAVQSDGNVAIYPAGGGAALWATGTNGQ